MPLWGARLLGRPALVRAAGGVEGSEIGTWSEQLGCRRQGLSFRGWGWDIVGV